MDPTRLELSKAGVPTKQRCTAKDLLSLLGLSDPPQLNNYEQYEYGGSILPEKVRLKRAIFINISGAAFRDLCQSSRLVVINC